MSATTIPSGAHSADDEALEAPHSPASPHAPDSASRPRQRTRRGLLGALTGSAFEVFDWSIYTTFAAFFAASFFADEGVSAWLGANVVFAVGFVARPVGSLIFGRISDVRGRRVSLFATSATALLGTLMIALAPTHEQIGVWASVVLVTARVIQGFAHGGEQPAAGAYIAEIALPANRGRWSSLIYVSILAGGLLGQLMGAILTSVFGPEEVAAWAWRIAFVVGALGSLFALWMVSRLHETEVFEDALAAGGGAAAGVASPTGAASTVEATPARPSLVREMVRAWRPALMIIGLTLGITIAFQNWAAMTGYHIAVFRADPQTVFWASIGANVVAMAALPVWGAVSDRVGRRPVVAIGLAGVAATTYPLMQALDGSPMRMFATMALSLTLLAAPLSILPALMAELVPTSIRTIGVGFAYALATAIFGGTVPFLQGWIGANWGPQAFGIYVTLAALVSLAVVATIPETRGKDLTDEHTTDETELA